MLGLVRLLIDYNGLVNAPRVAELGLMLVAEISGVHLKRVAECRSPKAMRDKLEWFELHCNVLNGLGRGSARLKSIAGEVSDFSRMNWLCAD